MTNVRLPRAVCRVVVGEVLSRRWSHPVLNALFLSSGAPGEPPALSNGTKWKEWLFRAGMDASTDSLAVLGNVLEELMDVGPKEESAHFDDWVVDRELVVSVLEKWGFRYYRGGRVLPSGQAPDEVYPPVAPAGQIEPAKPTEIDELLLRVAFLPGTSSGMPWADRFLRTGCFFSRAPSGPACEASRRW